MKVQVEELSPIERKLSIEVEHAQVNEELTRAYATLSRQVKIAGFRPGKVPRRILEQRFRQQVEDDVIHKVVERAYFEAIREHKVEAVGQPQVTNDKLKADAPFAFEARVEVKPKLEAKDYKGVPLKKLAVSIDDARVDEQLTQMQQSMTRLEPVAGREAVAEGDVVTVDYHATSEGKDFDGGKADNVSIEATPGELVQAHCAALVGVKIGESKEIDYAFPPDYADDQMKGKTAHFKLTVKGLKTKVTPEINDDLAKELGGGVQSLAELKTKIRTDLEKAEKNKAENDEREALIKGLVERNPFEVPKAMVERALDMMLDGALRAMTRGGLDPRRLNLDFGALREEMRPRAINEVKGSLLFESIAEKESITAPEDAVEKKIEELAEQSGQALSMVKKHFKNPDERRSLSLRLREEKTIEFLKSQATYS